MIIKQFFKKIRALRLKKIHCDKQVTIISNNCLAGLMYHDVHSRFYSPTINSFIGSEDFVYFCENLKYFIKNGHLENKPSKVTYPVATLFAKDLKPITIYFMHYSSFEEAKNKWDSRCKRFLNKRVVILFQKNKQDSDEIVKRIKNLQFDTFVLSGENSVDVCYIKYLKKHDCDLSKFVSLLGKRKYDVFNFKKEIFGIGE